MIDDSGFTILREKSYSPFSYFSNGRDFMTIARRMVFDNAGMFSSYQQNDFASLLENDFERTTQQKISEKLISRFHVIS
jgi:hypothetical protein